MEVWDELSWRWLDARFIAVPADLDVQTCR